jgi:hypothetical protein
MDGSGKFSLPLRGRPKRLHPQPANRQRFAGCFIGNSPNRSLVLPPQYVITKGVATRTSVKNLFRIPSLLFVNHSDRDGTHPATPPTHFPSGRQSLLPYPALISYVFLAVSRNTCSRCVGLVAAFDPVALGRRDNRPLHFGTATLRLFP